MPEKIIRLLYYSLFFLTPLIMFPATSELFEFNKMMFIYVTSTVVGFLLALEFIVAKKSLIPKTFFNWSLLFFFSALVISTFYSIDSHTSLFGYYGRFNGGLFSLCSYILLFYGFVSHFYTLKDLERILKISWVSSLIVIIWGLPGRLGYDLSCYLFTHQLTNSCWSDQFRPQDRMFSTLGQPNWLGAFLAINFFIGLYFYFKKNKHETTHWINMIPWLAAGYLVTNFAGILFTRSRSALIAVFIGFLFYLFFVLKSVWKNKDELYKSSKKFLALVVACFVLILMFKTGFEKIDKFISLSAKSVQSSPSTQLSSEVTESLDIRKIVWKGAVALGMRYPLFGTGPETFAYSYYFTRPIEHNLTSEWDFIYNKAHNEYLNYLATTGFIGLGTYLFMIGSVLYLFINKLKTQNSKILLISLFASYITILITNFFGFSTTTINIYFYLLPGFLLIQSKSEGDKKKVSTNISNSLLILISLCVIMYVLFFLFNYYRGDIAYSQANSYSNSDDYIKAFESYKEAFDIRNQLSLLYPALLTQEHVHEDKFSYTLANLAVLSAVHTDKGPAYSLMKTSNNFNLLSLKASPKNVLYWKTRAKNYYLYYQITSDKKDLQKGLDALKVTEKLSPTDPKVSYTQTVLYDLMGQPNRALSSINKTLSLKPDYKDGYMLKAQLLKKYGRKKEAQDIYKFILKNISPDDPEVIDELKNL